MSAIIVAPTVAIVAVKRFLPFLCLVTGCYPLDSLDTCDVDEQCGLTEQCVDGLCESEPTVRIGATLPLTGYLDGARGAAFVRAADLALLHLNEAGGIDGRRVVLDVQNDIGEPEEAVRNAERFLEDRSLFVLGPVRTVQNEQVFDVAYPPKLMMLTPSGGFPTRPGTGPTSTLGFASEGVLSTALSLAFATDGELSCASTMWVTSQDRFGQGWLDVVANTSDDVCVVAAPTVPIPDAPDSAYEHALEDLREHRPECILIAAGPDAARVIGQKLATTAEEMRVDNPNYAPYVIHPVASTSDALTVALEAAGLREYLVATDDRPAGNPSFDYFAEAYEATYGFPPEDAASRAYDAIMVMGVASHWALSTDPPVDRAKLVDAFWELAYFDNALLGPESLETLITRTQTERARYTGAQGDLLWGDSSVGRLRVNGASVERITSAGNTVAIRFSPDDILSSENTLTAGCP